MAHWEDSGSPERRDGYTLQRKRNLGAVQNEDYRYFYSIAYDDGSTDVALGPGAYGKAIRMATEHVEERRERASAQQAASTDVPRTPEENTESSRSADSTPSATDDAAPGHARGRVSTGVHRDGSEQRVRDSGSHAHSW